MHKKNNVRYRFDSIKSRIKKNVADNGFYLTMSASRIEYSEKYADDNYEYRYVIVTGTFINCSSFVSERASYGSIAGNNLNDFVYFF